MNFNILDLFRRKKTVTSFFPLAGKRQFESALFSRNNSTFENARLVEINQILVTQLPILKARSRFLAQNSSLVNSYIINVGKNVIGAEGIKFKSKAMKDDGKPDIADNLYIERAWAEFEKNPSVTGRQTLKEFERSVENSIAIDGEAVIVRHDGFPNNKSKIGVQLVDSAMLDVQYNTVVENGNRVIMGIEFDQWGAPQNYYFRSPYGSLLYSTFQPVKQSTHTVIPADRVYHLFTEKFAGQVRGYPELSSVIADTRILDNYIEASLTAADNASSLFGSVEQDPNSASFKGQRVDGQQETDLQPGTVKVWAPGQKFNLHKPEHPTITFSDFVKANQKQIAAALGMSYSALVGDYSDANYSSLRAAFLSDRETYKVKQDMIIEKFLMPLFEKWKLMQMTTGNLKLPISRIAKFQPAFYARGWDWVDPKADATAVDIELGLGLTSRTRELAAMGVDFSDVADELAQEQAILEARKVVLAGSMPQPPKDGFSNEGKKQAIP